jgi:hypothetical protein
VVLHSVGDPAKAEPNLLNAEGNSAEIAVTFMEEGETLRDKAQREALDVLLQNIRSKAELPCSMDLNTASAKELDRLFDAQISGPLSWKSWFISDLISFTDN